MTTQATEKPIETPGFWSRLFRHFTFIFDGTLVNTLFYGNEDKARLKDLYRDYNGFLEIEARETRTRRIQAFDDILKGDDTWAALNEKMDAYFLDVIEMFPYHRRTPKTERNVHIGHAITNPDHYFKIRLATLQRRFPGGTDGKIGDQDVRDLTCALRVVYKEDLVRLIVARRFWATMGMIALCVCFAVSIALLPQSLASAPVDLLGLTLPTGILIDAGIVLFTGIVACVGLMLFINHTTVNYESALKTSTSNLRNALHPRLTESVSLIAQIMSQIDREKMELKSENRLKDWPEVVTRWTKLAFWLTARVEAVEDFIQIQMWIIRRIHYGLRNLAGIATFLIFAGFCAFIGLSLAGWFSFTGPSVVSTSLSWVLAGVCLAMGFVLSMIAHHFNIPDFELEDILQMHLIMGHKDTKLHDELANLIKREKLTILHDEEMFKGNKPR